MGRLIDPGYVFEDDDSQPLSSGTVTFYTSGTTTLRATYADRSLSTQNANPMTIRIDGRLANDVWGTGNYTIRVADVNGRTIYSRPDLEASANSDDIVYDRTGSNERTLTEKLNDWFHVADYGAAPGNSASINTNAIKAACTALQANGGGTLLFDPGTYQIYQSGSLSGAAVMNTFTNLKGVTIEGRGANLSILDVFSTSETLTHFQFQGCTDVTVRNMTFTSTPEGSGTASQTRGQQPIVLKSTTENILIENVKQFGGLTGVTADRLDSSSETTKCKNVSIVNWYGEDIGWAFKWVYSGDRVTLQNVHCVRPGQAYWATGVRNHRGSLRITDGRISPCVSLAAYTINATLNYLESVDLKLSYESSAGTAQADVVCVDAFRESTATGFIANIRDISVALSGTSSDSGYQYAFQIRKLINDGLSTVDAGATAHVIEKVSFGNGTWRLQYPQLVMVNLCGTGTGTWSSTQIMRGLRVENWIITGNTANNALVDGSALLDNFMVENVIAPFDFTASNFLTGVLKRNCLLGTATYNDNVNSVQILTGAGAVDLTHRTTQIISTGANALTLADGVEGQQKILVMITDAGDATLTPTNFAGPGTTIVFDDVGDAVHLLFSNGKWTTLSKPTSTITTFTSSQQAVAATGSVAHGLGVMPFHYSVRLINIITNAGYAVNDEEDIHAFYTSGGGAAGDLRPGIWANATSIGWTMDATPAVPHKTTGVSTTITPADWRIIVRASV